MKKRLTKPQMRALRVMLKHDFICQSNRWIDAGVIAPPCIPAAVMFSLYRRKLATSVGNPGQIWVKAAITDAGRAALKSGFVT